MKKLLSILFALCVSANAADIVTLTITVTNAPSGHDTLTVNANVRTWTNNATATPQSLITIGASAGASATNLWNQIGLYPYSGPLTRKSFSSSNVINLQGQVGQALTASISGTWAALSYSTQTVSTLTAVRVPISGEPTASTATNIASLLATGLGTHSTNALATGTTLLQNVVQTSGDQSIGGSKTFEDETYHLSGVWITNAYPYAYLWFYDGAGSADYKMTRLQQGNDQFTISTIDDMGANTDAIIINPATGIVTFGGGVEASIFYGPTLTNAAIQNSAFVLTNTVTGVWSYPRANHTSLANGNNAGVSFGTNIFTKIKAGPSAAFAICGIAGGQDGRVLKLYNATGQNMTISNDSGVEPTAANRIYTGTGSDIATTGNGFVNLIYDSEDSRWIVTSYQP